MFPNFVLEETKKLQKKRNEERVFCVTELTKKDSREKRQKRRKKRERETFDKEKRDNRIPSNGRMALAVLSPHILAGTRVVHTTHMISSIVSQLLVCFMREGVDNQRRDKSTT